MGNSNIINDTNLNIFNKVEPYVKNCYETAGILLGRTTIEGWLCGKSGWIYNVDDKGEILNKRKHEVPSDVSKFDYMEVAKKIKEKYIKLPFVSQSFLFFSYF